MDGLHQAGADGRLGRHARIELPLSVHENALAVGIYLEYAHRQRVENGAPAVGRESWCMRVRGV